MIVVIEFRWMIRFPGFEQALQLHDFRGDGGGQFQHGFLTRRGAFLRQKTGGNAALENNGAGVGRFLFQDQGKERGFSRAVGPDQPDAVAAIHLERNALEQGASTKDFADIGNR